MLRTFFCLSLAPALFAATGKPAAAVSRPLSFEANRGQFAEAVRFRAHSSTAEFWLLREETVVAFPDGRQVRLRWRGGSSAELRGANELITRSHYPGDRITDVPHFDKVSQADLYPGIDAVYCIRDNRLAFDLMVKPGANPSLARLMFDGADSVRLEKSGELLVTAGRNELRLRKPVSWQETASGRKPVDSRFRTLASREVGFALGPYDRSLPLVIDPTYTSKIHVGSNGFDNVFDIAGTPGNDIVAIGQTGSTATFRPNLGVTPGIGFTTFVMMLNPDMTQLIYVTYLGSGAGFGVDVDAQSNAYVTGLTSAANFPTTPDAIQTDLRGGNDAFIAKLNVKGEVVWGTRLGGFQLDFGLAIEQDGFGKVCMTGRTGSDNLINVGPTPSSFAGGTDDVMVACFQDSASPFLVRSFGSTGTDIGTDIGFDKDGFLVTTGFTGGGNFPTTAGAFQTNKIAGGTAAFVSRISMTGQIVNSTFLSGSVNEFANTVSIFPSGEIAIGGGSQSLNMPGASGICCVSQKGFITILNPDLSQVVRTTMMPFSGEVLDSVSGIETDANAIYAVGVTGPSALGLPASTQSHAYSAVIPKNGGPIQDFALVASQATAEDLLLSLFPILSVCIVGRVDIALTPPLSPLNPNHQGSADGYVACEKPTTTLPRGPVLKVTKQDGYADDYTTYNIRRGSTIRFRVIVENVGDEPATGVTLRDFTPGQTPRSGNPEILINTSGANGIQPCTAEGNQLTCVIDSIAPGGRADLYLSFTAATEGNFYNSLRVRSNAPKVEAIGFVEVLPANAAPTISPAGITTGAGASVDVVEVNSSSPIQGVSLVPWLRLLRSVIRSPIDIPGPGRVQLTIDANPSAAPRTGTVDFGGRILTVTQAGAGCDFTLSTQGIAVPAFGGAQSVNVNTAAGCAWSSAANPAFLTATSAGGTGSGAAGFRAAVNTSNAPRAGSLRIGSQVVQIMQNAAVQARFFNDVPLTHPFYNHIALMNLRAITSGCGAFNYCPDAGTTRGQMAVFIVRAVYGNDNFPFSQTPAFTDVPAAHPFFRWIQKMRELGITAGCTATTYCPDAPVTRGQMAVFITRARLLLASGDAFPFPQTPFFTDVPAGHPFFSFIQKMKELGITAGCTATSYCPDDPVTRGQMGVFVIRLQTP